MYLTRTKLVAAGVVLAGLLTTGIGALSTADAQGPSPADADAAALKKYYDALRAHQAPKDRFEYKFVPVERPLAPADLQKVLAAGDQEGWGYCGSQELVQEKTGKVTPHMVFKRPRTVAAADEDRAVEYRRARAALAGAHDETARERAAALLELAKRQDAAVAEQRAAAEAAVREANQRLQAEVAAKERAALLDQVKRQEAAVAAERARAEKALRDAERVRMLTDDREAAAAERAAALAERADALGAETELRAQRERNLREQAKALEAAAAQSATNEAARRRELEAMKAQYEELIQKLQAELKAKGGAGNPFAADPDKVITAVVKLTNVDGKTAAAGLAKVMPQAKVVAEATSNSITLTGPAKVVTAAREVIQKSLDVKPGAAADDKPETMTIALKHTNAADVANALKSAVRGTQVTFSYDSAGNRLIVTGPPKVIADVKKLVAELDQAGEKK